MSASGYHVLATFSGWLHVMAKRPSRGAFARRPRPRPSSVSFRWRGIRSDRIRPSSGDVGANPIARNLRSRPAVDAIERALLCRMAAASQIGGLQVGHQSPFNREQACSRFWISAAGRSQVRTIAARSCNALKCGRNSSWMPSCQPETDIVNQQTSVCRYFLRKRASSLFWMPSMYSLVNFSEDR